MSSLLFLSARRNGGIFRFIELRFEKGPQILWALYAGQTAVEDDLGHAQCGGDLRLQDVALGRIQETVAATLVSNLISYRICGSDEHLIRDSSGFRCVDRQTDGREDIEVVPLSGQKRLALKLHWRELHARGIQSAPLGPAIRF